MKVKPKTKFANLRRAESAQATVEFALVAGFLFATVFAIVDFSRLFFAYTTMSNGVREGARYAVVHAEPGQEDAIIAQAMKMMILLGGTATVEVDFPDVDKEGGPYCSHFCRVVVRAESDFDVWTPIAPNLRIEAQATMHLE